MRLRVNITANFFGQMISTGIGFVFIPIYISFLGVESYGLIGFFSVITAWLGILDAGLSPAIGKEMSLLKTDKHSPHSIRTLLLSVEYFFIGISIITFSLIFIFSDWLSINWIKSEVISNENIKKAIWLMGALFSLKFFESIYKNSFLGLEYQVSINSYEAFIAIFKAIGSVILLKYYSANILVFFQWQLLSSILYIIWLKSRISRILPTTNKPVTFSLLSLSSVKTFAGGMLVMSFLSLLHTQVDKILLSKILSLQDFGIYTIAFTAAGALMIFTSPIAQAIFPRMNQLYQLNVKDDFFFLFHVGNQLILVLIGSASMVVIFFPKLFLFFWTNNMVIAENAHLILAVASLGFFLSGINTMSFSILMIYSWLQKINIIKVISVLITIPVIIFFVPRYGAIIAAFAWVFVALLNTLFSVWIIFHGSGNSSIWNWLKYDVLYPLLPIIIFLSICKNYIFDINNRYTAGLLLVGLILISILLSSLFCRFIRKKGIDYLKYLFVDTSA